MDIDREGSQIAESIPNCAAYREIDGFELDRQTQSVEFMTVRDVGIYRPQTTRHLRFANPNVI